ncbi:MAG: DNA translocase FtsK 4TM domain-containing protein [Pontiellaceae bacterium]|nr:DNA translocase FtsK 4TM domain-containing protein [Pontiellaceae bacterium]
MGKKEIDRKGHPVWREFTGIVIGILGLVLLLGMLSYDESQVGAFNSDPVWTSNWAGFVGAWLACGTFMLWGLASYTVPVALIWMSISSLLRSGSRTVFKIVWFVLGLTCLAGLIQMNAEFWNRAAENINQQDLPGGVIGNALAGEFGRKSLVSLLGAGGTGLLFVVFLVLSVVKLFNVSLIEFGKWIWGHLRRVKIERREEKPTSVKREKEPRPKKEKPPKVKRERPEPKKKKSKPETAPAEESDVDIRKLLVEQQNLIDLAPVVESGLPPPPPEKNPRKKPRKVEMSSNDAHVEPFAQVDEGAHGDYILPPLSLLDPPVPQSKGMSANEIADTAEILQKALEEFGVEAKVTGVQQGPVVTCYEILPASGVRVERIKSLSDNLALKMHAESIRIQAPIPGKGVCGVEIPNTSRASVFFRELVESRVFQSDKHALPLVLGKDVNGHSITFDLAKMPHLLIAGATGAGKSVCMNSILTGLLMKHSPDAMRLILVDPKTVEFHAYNNLPHLVVPVITNAKKVALGLKWAIDEMERRFRWFRQAGVRDLPSFNARAVQKQTELFGDELDSGDEKKNELPEKLPYIVIVIDELADLMHVAQAEIEAGIARLAAKSRAAGIHMILATQRPDVKVITGTIKANFPVRIAFKVSQKVDSRTILDRMGADTLLGKGDMLVLPPGTDKLIRLQGVYTSDGEIDRVTNFCKEQCQPEFITEIHEKIENKTVDLPEVDDGGDDEIVEQAIEVIRQTKRASTSSLQRRLRIGYTRAARVMDLLEERGIVGPPDGAGPREILIDLDGEIPQNTGAADDAAG